MVKINKCLKEWNVVVESLGQGKQTILIRKYQTNLKDFLLYPTYSYTNNEKYLDSFQNKYQSFVEKNKLPKLNEDKIQIKYYARVEKIIEKNPSRIGSLKEQFIWTPKHVKSYLNGKKANLWILRAYKLKKPVMIEKVTGPILYANLKEDVSLDGIEPVISDSEFSKIVNEIE